MFAVTQWINDLFNKYDKSFLFVLGLVFFSQGFKVFIELSVKDLFKHYMLMEPNDSQIMISIITLPWCFKIFYGLIADNFAIFGSRRRAYIILNGLIQCCSLWALAFTNNKNKLMVTGLLTLNSLNSAFFNVVVNALMVA